MTQDNPFDFNDASEPYRCLGHKLDIAVQDAAGLIASTSDKAAHALAALRVARVAVSRVAQRDAATPQATTALLDVMEALAEAEKLVKSLQSKSAGAPLKQNEHQARAREVWAVLWLEQLRTGAMKKGEALNAVATAWGPLRHDKLQVRIKQLKGWISEFTSAQENRYGAQKSALANVRAEMFDEFYRCWREPLRELPTGEIEYSDEWHEHDYRDMSRDTVLEWLRHGSAASELE